MKGTIVHFRGSYKTKRNYGNHMIILVDGVTSRDNAHKLVGKKVVYTTEGGKHLIGKVAAPHGNKGVVRAIFETGMPGQSLGKEVKIE